MQFLKSSIGFHLPNYKLPTALLDMHHLSCGISFLLPSVNFVPPPLSSWFSSTCASPHHSSPPSLSPSITPSALHSRLKNSSRSKILSSIVFLVPSQILNPYTGLRGHWRLFGFLFILFVLPTWARLSWSHSAFESTLKSSIVSYRNNDSFSLEMLFSYRCVLSLNKKPSWSTLKSSIVSYRNNDSFSLEMLFSYRCVLSLNKKPSCR